MSDKKTNAIRILDKNKIAYETYIYDVDETHLDAVTVAEKINQDIKYVYKTLVLQGSDKNYRVCVINGQDELDLKKTAKAFGLKNIAMIHVNEINTITGYIRGGCSPLGMKKSYTTIIDEKAKKLDYIIVSAGKRGMQIRLDVNELANVVGAGFDDLVKGE